VAEVYRPLLRTAELLLPASKDGVRTAFIGTLDQDIYVRMARRHAADVGWPRPVALYVRAVAGLHPYIDQATGSYVDVMNPESETTSIYLDESAQAVATKLKRALTGGGRTKEEHAALGGNPDTRLCSISSLLAFFLADSAEEHAQIADECRRGVRFCGDCKQLCLERLNRLPLDENAD
jgi:tryptophanyl-tRNA synthetase